MIDLWSQLLNQLPFEWAHYSFMQHALLAGMLLAPLFALPGCLVINNQMSFFSDAIGHAALTGIAIGAIAGLANPLWSMILFAVALAILLSILKKIADVSTDTIIGLIMSGAVSLGIVILSRGGGFNKYSRYLIGDLLSITGADIAGIVIALFLMALAWVFFFNQLFLTSFNPVLSKIRGNQTWLLETAFSVFVAVLVTISVQWIGILVVNSLLILPAAAARNISLSLRQYILTSLGISLFSCLTGMICSYYWETATGATIVLISLSVFMISTLLPIIKKRVAQA